jgi:glutamate--cysteine ligase
LRDLAKTLINDMTPIAECLDIANKNTAYSSALITCEQKLENDSLLPAAKIISKIRDTGKSFQEITLKSAQDYSEHFAAMTMDQDLIGHYSNAALESIKKQNTLEQSDTLSFEEFVKLFS